MKLITKSKMKKREEKKREINISKQKTVQNVNIFIYF